MTKRIDFFDGTAYDFLSNFHDCGPVSYQGSLWPTTEHAYQAMKSIDESYQERVREASTPGEAKALGQMFAFERDGVKMVPDWERRKFHVMLDLLRVKFQKPAMRAELLDTGSAELIEGNTWSDTCWGVCDKIGTNHLGRQLMRVRAELKPTVKDLWHVVGVGAGRRYVRTAECKSLTGVRRATEALALKIGAGRADTAPRVAVMLASIDKHLGEQPLFDSFGGGYVEVEKVK